MKHLHTFESFLNELNYGNKLWADSSYTSFSKDYANLLKRMYNSEFEKDTKEERKIWSDLKDYIKLGKGKLSVSELKELLPLKPKFPEMLDPLYHGQIDRVWRGTSIDMSELINIAKKGRFMGINDRTKSYDFDINYVNTSRTDKGFLSFSKDEMSSRNFAFYNLHNSVNQGRYPVILGCLYRDVEDKMLFNSQFIDILGGAGEEEVIYTDRTFKATELKIIKPESAFNIRNRQDLLTNPEISAEVKQFIVKLNEIIEP
jgi:hypothetical protein